MRRIVKQKKQTKLGVAIIICIAITLITSIGVIIFLSTSKRNDKRYNNLVANITSVSKSNIDTIIKDMEFLSSTYKDMSSLKKQFEEIKWYVTYINSYADQTKDLSADHCEKVRKFYSNLYNFDKKYENWNLEKYLAEINIVQLVFGDNWAKDSLYFNWYEDPKNNNKMTLKTNVPNALDPNKQYTYGVKYSPQDSNSAIIYYKNKNDANDSFDAYQISNFKVKGDYYYFDVLCNSRQTKYTMNLKMPY